MTQSPTATPDPPTYTVQTFCEAHHISRTTLYELWREGRGPRRIKVGARTLITGEAASAWRRQMEHRTQAVSLAPGS